MIPSIIAVFWLLGTLITMGLVIETKQCEQRERHNPYYFKVGLNRGELLTIPLLWWLAALLMIKIVWDVQYDQRKEIKKRLARAATAAKP